MELKQLYQYLGSYIRNGYGHLNVAVENMFGEGGDLNSISISKDGTTICLKESHGPQFFEGGLYEIFSFHKTKIKPNVFSKINHQILAKLEANQPALKEGREKVRDGWPSISTEQETE